MPSRAVATRTATEMAAETTSSRANLL